MSYYTVRIPAVPYDMSTEWHPTSAIGPFSVLTRGAFSTEIDAIKWAALHLNGMPYSVVEVQL